MSADAMSIHATAPGIAAFRETPQRLLTQMREILRVKHLYISIENSCYHWIRFFVGQNNRSHKSAVTRREKGI
jgi:hypothetical protein